MAINRFKNLDKEKAKEIIRTTNPKEDALKDSKLKDSKTNDSVKITSNDTSKPNNKPRKVMSNEKKKAIEKFGVSIRSDIKKKIDELGKNSNNLKPNAVVVNLLDEIFDGKNFNINFEKKIDSKITSYNLPSEMIQAINKINAKTNIPKSEIFNKLLEEALKNYY